MSSCRWEQVVVCLCASGTLDTGDRVVYGDGAGDGIGARAACIL